MIEIYLNYSLFIIDMPFEMNSLEVLNDE